VAGGAQLSVPDLRRANRHPVDYPVIGEHRARGDLQLHIANISAHGFLIDSAPELSKGDRIILRLPVIGRIEAYVIWIADERAGFQFERIIRLDDFLAMIGDMQPNPKLRRPR
jgi:hypothetical protein